MSTTQLHTSIAHLEMPGRIKRLPVDERLFPVPFFVAYVDGKPDHRIMDGNKFKLCVTRKLCWICGEVLGRYLANVLGPMCTITRTVPEPPMHKECAEYSVQACPFLSRPHMIRREAGVPEEAEQPAGIAIKRNPGVAALWISRVITPFLDPKGGMLFKVGDPENVSWYCQGRTATRAEVQESIDSGLPILYEHARYDGPMAVADLDRRCAAVERYLPKE